ncbi:MAG: DUF429 domain-containing protein [Cyanobacteria bacterium P01_A01_bin.3]
MTNFSYKPSISDHCTECVAGIDGCRAGWIAIALADRGFSHKLLETSQDLLEFLQAATLTFIDIPIGLSDSEASRSCDRLLRDALRPHFSSSVFNPPVRQAVYARSYEEACQRNAAASGKKISKQSWNISIKIRLIDELLLTHPSLSHTVLESHPEYLFFNLNDHHLTHKKKTDYGRLERLQLLAKFFPAVEDVFGQVRSHYLKKQMADDDIVDALGLAIGAQLTRKHGLMSLPHPIERDKHGIPMAIHYAKR